MERQHLYLGWNGSSQSCTFICRKHKQMPLLFQRREGRKPQQTGRVCVCVSACEKTTEGRGERERADRDQSRGYVLNLRVGGEASPTHNALPHSLQATQVFRSITSLSSEHIMILPPHLSSPDILRKSWNSVIHKLLLPHVCSSSIMALQCRKHKVYKISTETLLRFTVEDCYWVGLEPTPHFPISWRDEVFLFNSAWEAANRCPSVHTEGMWCPLTQMKSHESLCVALSVS